MAEERSLTLGEVIAGELGCHVNVVQALARTARWSSERFRAEMRSGEDWRAKFTADLQAGRAAGRTAQSFAEVLSTGPAALAAKSFAELVSYIKHPKLRELAECYDDATEGGILVIGMTDIGKTVSAAAAMRRLIEREEQAHAHEDINRRKTRRMWVRAFDLPNARLEQRLGAGDAPLVTDAKSAEFLVLDDLGWEGQRAGAADVVIEVLAHRYDRGTPSIVTSGLSYEQIEARYGDAVIRRIVQAGGKPGRVVNCWAKESEQPHEDGGARTRS